MGMFDYITGIEIYCPKCGNKLTEFQSKSGMCVMTKLDYKDVDDFYDICDKCETFVSVERDKPFKNVYKVKYCVDKDNIINWNDFTQTNMKNIAKMSVLLFDNLFNPCKSMQKEAKRRKKFAEKLKKKKGDK